MTARMALALGLVLALAACSNNPQSGGPQGMTAAQAAQLNAEHSASSGDLANPPPVTADTHFAAGHLAENQGNLPGAIAQYKEALKLDKKHVNATYHLALVQTQLEQYDDAIDTWTDYVSLTKGNAVAYSNLGFCYDLAARPDDAEKAYRNGIKADPQCQACRVNYGMLLARRGRVNEAILQWQTVLTPAEVHYNLGTVYAQQNRKLQARSEYMMALKLDPSFDDARQRMAALDMMAPTP